MLELIYRARWDQAYLFLASGEPSLAVKLFALNAFFLVLYAIRKVSTQKTITMRGLVQLHLLIFLANCVVLFQYDIQRLTNPLILRI
ncbi:hypothetical protein [Aestuariivirga sp.]|uniref:hypothetical protein n=1 Tax=Aestuariivirga sp. TaxID=2650926 RepID=UPI0039199E14